MEKSKNIMNMIETLYHILNKENHRVSSFNSSK